MAQSDLAKRLNVPDSAFKNCKFNTLGEQEISRPVTLPGILLPNGKVFVSPNEYIAGSVYTLFTMTLGGSKIGIKGKWVFVPDEEENEDEVDEAS